MKPSLSYENIASDIKKTIALILAGGRGVRLKELTDWRVKPAVPFGGKYRIIDFVLSNCVNSEIRKIGILTQYKSQSLIRHVMRGWELFHAELGEFIECVPAQQRQGDDWYSGTANAIYQNMDLIYYHRPSYVLILAGDHIYKMDYRSLLAFHTQNEAELTIASTYVPINEASRFGVMETNQKYRVTAFNEKPEAPSTSPHHPDYALASMGIYVFNTDFLKEVLYKDAKDIQSDHDFGRNIIPSLINDHRVYAFPFFDFQQNQSLYWKDVGTVDAYWKASMDLIGVSPELNLYDADWPIRTAANNYPPAKFVFNDPDRQGKAVDSIVAEGCIISGASVTHSVLSNNVRVEEHSTVDNSILLPNVVIGPNCRIKNAIIDKECRVPQGTVIGEDPEADARDYDLSPEGVTLVEPEMLGQQIHQIE
ncbi:glucose-1-phosphate adenylyltransferase [Gracilimonas mengyeensis]|uniref:Glucose-1-phosphate adenylyltransferase n=1 Tax=Gracilimonas mengyeensis TaxID=1302730 RepID=A0A521E8A1_9BACT|nr:glucose-1-phosphate adenylyltransferase [Gracilimonas mengyeensis]SMO80139.1 glucose-1-phosphate adenylyltransferase [Gracilimonas mengyeensis]